MKLTERDKELAALGELFAECLEGRGRVAVVRGAVASGKTALLHTFAERATASGATFLGATASRIESMLPLGLVSQLLHGAELSTESAERARSLLDDGALTAAVHESGSGMPAALRVAEPIMRLLCEALLDLAERGPVVIGIDDAHYADLSSLQCLRYLVPRMTSARMLLVINECTGPLQAHPVFHAELTRQPHCRRIRLNLLSQSGLAAMFSSRLTPRDAYHLAPAGHRATGGNPLLAEALLEDCRDHAKGGPVELVPGEAFGQAVLNCLYRGEPSMLDLARAVAVMGEPASPAVLGELLDMDVESATQTRQALNAAGLLDGGRFRHSAARAAVLDGMTPEERAGMHARAAHVMRERGAAATIVARHIIAAHPVRAPWVVPVLREAAEQALVDDEVPFAIGCLRLAYEACPNEQERARIKSTLARAEWRVNPSAAARHLPELTTAVREGRLKWRHATVAIAQLLWHGRTKEAIEALDMVERQHDSARTPDAVTAVAAPEAVTALATARQSTSDDLAEQAATVGLDAIRMWLWYSYPELVGQDRGEQAMPAGEPGASSRTRQVQAASSLATALTSGMDEGALAKAEQVLEASRLDDATLVPITAALAALIYANRLDRAALWCDSLLKEATSRHAPMWQALLAAIRSTIDFRQGRLVAAEKSARDCLTLISPKCWGVGIGAPLNSMLLTLTAMGKYDDAAAYLSMPVPEAMFLTPFGLHYLQARGRYYLATGRLKAALGDFQASGELMTRWGFDLPTLVAWRTDAAQAYLKMGRTREAMDLVLEQLAKLRPEQRRPRAVALRVLAAASPVEQRVVLLEEAVELLDECGDRFEMAIALADLSAAHRALGDYCQARALAERAHWLAEVCGAEPLRQRLLAEVSDTELRMQARRAAETSPIGELSEAELRVAALAVQGYTNREIAKKLFVTVSTVEQHLTRVYRKLKVRRRTDLPAELQEHLSDATPVAAVGESGAVKQPRLRWSRPARPEPANGRRVWTAAAQ